jgi:catechol 2,3-dioxygenase-like lactoylglutathione lyase family enzyme
LPSAAPVWQNAAARATDGLISEVGMGSRLTEIVVDCPDPVAQAAFWTAALGYHVVHGDATQVEIAPWEREPPDLAEQVRQAPTVPTLVFVVVPEGKTVKNRLHLDIRPVASTYEAEVERLIGLGARRADIGQQDVPWVVLADPEGNEFCVLGPLGDQTWNSASRPG